MRRVYPHEIEMVEHVRYLEAGGRMEFLDWFEVRQEHREMLLSLAEGGWSGDQDHSSAGEVPERMSELEHMLGYWDDE